MTQAVLKDLAPTGTLRAAINYGNGVLAQRGADDQDPKGVSADLARELGKRLGVPSPSLDSTRRARYSTRCEAGPNDPKAWDIAFLAIEPVRAAQIAFTAPYVLIEGTYLVRKDSPLQTTADLDRPGHRIAVATKAAYDLYLTRTLKHAELVRGEAPVERFLARQARRRGRRAPVARALHPVPPGAARDERHASWKSVRPWARRRDAMPAPPI